MHINQSCSVQLLKLFLSAQYTLNRQSTNRDCTYSIKSVALSYMKFARTLLTHSFCTRQKKLHLHYSVAVFAEVTK